MPEPTVSITVHNLALPDAARVLASAAPAEPLVPSRFTRGEKLLEDMPADVAHLADFFASLDEKQLDRVWVAALIDHLATMLPAGTLTHITRALLHMRQRMRALPEAQPQPAGTNGEVPQTDGPLPTQSPPGALPAGSRLVPVNRLPIPGPPGPSSQRTRSGPYTPQPGTKSERLHKEMCERLPAIGDELTVHDVWPADKDKMLVRNIADRDQRFEYISRGYGVPASIKRVKEN